jgi:alpha-L-arabinofuranosidase
VGEKSPVPNTRGWRNDLVAALKQIKVPNLRWPGGCFADDYHWREGIGPREKRPKRINAHWGGVIEDNAVGTHEFLDLCEQIGCEPYLAGNVGSGSPRELREWVEYCNAPAGSLAEERAANGRKEPWKVRLWGVGNETWGCGGNMTAEYYANEYRRFATYVRDFPDAKIYRVASGARNDDYHWTDVMMREAFKGGPIKIMSDGSIVRSIMYASDFANWILHITAYATPRSVYNVGSPEAIDLLSLAKMIRSYFKTEPQVLTSLGNITSRTDLRVVPNVDKAEKELQLKITVDKETAIQRSMEWHSLAMNGQ